MIAHAHCTRCGLRLWLNEDSNKQMWYDTEGSWRCEIRQKGTQTFVILHTPDLEFDEVGQKQMI